MGIDGFDQRDLLRSSPTLQLFLATDGSVHTIKRFPIEQALHVVFVGETLETVKLVFEGSRVKLAGPM
jgi:hypothetical protein